MIERGIARDGYKILDTGGKEIGYVTSGSFAPLLEKKYSFSICSDGICRGGFAIES